MCFLGGGVFLPQNLGGEGSIVPLGHLLTRFNKISGRGGGKVD